MKFYNLVIPAAAAILLGVVNVSDANANGGQHGGGTNATAGSASVSTATNAGLEQSVTQPITVNVGGDSTVQERAAPAPESTTATIKSVPTAVAPALTTTLTETCMGSSSVGASGVGFGISFGTTWRDTACVRRLDSREVAKYSNQIAFEMMCDSDAVRKAAERAAAKYGADKVPVCADQEQK